MKKAECPVYFTGHSAFFTFTRPAPQDTYEFFFTAVRGERFERVRMTLSTVISLPLENLGPETYFCFG